MHPAAEVVGWLTDYARLLEHALALPFDGLPVWRRDGKQTCLAVRLSDFDVFR